MKKLAYCATPSRLEPLTQEIIDYAAGLGLAPFHPFPAFPRRHFEDGHVGRGGTIEICLKMVEICPLFLLFGISEGTLLELKHAIKFGKPIALVDGFDPERESFYSRLAEKHEYPLKGLQWIKKDNIEEIKRLLSTA